MRVTVGIHAGETLKPKTLHSILDQAGLTVEVASPLPCRRFPDASLREIPSNSASSAREAIKGYIKSLETAGEVVPVETERPQAITIGVPA